MADAQSVVLKTAETGAVAPVVTPAVVPGAPVVPVTPVKVERPAWLPEKFKDPEQLAVAYGELEKRMSGRTPAVETPVVTPAVTPAITPAVVPETPEAARTELTAKGLDYDKYATEVTQKGALSPESYAELAGKGYPKELVDRFYTGQQAIAQQRVTALLKPMASEADPDGSKTYGAISEWARASLTVAQLTAYNDAVVKGSPEMAELAVSGLHARYIAANGSDPALIMAGGTPGDAGDVYASRAEMVRDMRDPRYKNDRAFVAKVEAKVGRSNI